MKKLSSVLFVLAPATCFAGDSPLFWRFGDISNRLLFYTENGVLRTNIPTSVFLFGILISSIGLVGYLALLPTNQKKIREFIGLVPVLGSLSAFALSWILGSIGERFYGNYSVALFWSWHCSGAMAGAILAALAFLKFRTLKKQ